MADKVHAQFTLTEDSRVKAYSYSNGQGGYLDAGRFRFSAVQGEPFGTATPSGSVDIVIVNPEALSLFKNSELGQKFDFIISKAE